MNTELKVEFILHRRSDGYYEVGAYSPIVNRLMIYDKYSWLWETLPTKRIDIAKKLAPEARKRLVQEIADTLKSDIERRTEVLQALLNHKEQP